MILGIWKQNNRKCIIRGFNFISIYNRDFGNYGKQFLRKLKLQQMNSLVKECNLKDYVVTYLYVLRLYSKQNRAKQSHYPQYPDSNYNNRQHNTVQVGNYITALQVQVSGRLNWISNFMCPLWSFITIREVGTKQQQQLHQLGPKSTLGTLENCVYINERQSNIS